MTKTYECIDTRKGGCKCLVAVGSNLALSSFLRSLREDPPDAEREEAEEEEDNN